MPAADVSCLVVPEDIPDEKAVTLGDLCCTSWHGCELGEVSEGDNVAVWGAGPSECLRLTANCVLRMGCTGDGL